MSQDILLRKGKFNAINNFLSFVIRRKKEGGAYFISAKINSRKNSLFLENLEIPLRKREFPAAGK